MVSLKLSFKPDKDWNERVKLSEHSFGFQIKEYSEVYEKAFQSQPIFITVQENQKISAQLLAFIHSLNREKLELKNSKLKGLTWKYGPLIFDKNKTLEILNEILLCIEKLSKEYKIGLIRGTSPPKSNYLPDLPFKEHKYDLKKRGTFIVDLNQDSEKYFHNLNKKVRYDIKKAEKHGLSFGEASSKEDCIDFFKMKLYENANKTSLDTLDFEFVDAHISMMKKNTEKLFLARYKNKIVGGMRCFVFNGNIIQHSVATTSVLNIQSGSFLTWETIKWGMNNEQKKFDFGGYNPFPKTQKEKGIKYFKSKWQGEDILYDTYIKIPNNFKYKLNLLLTNPKKPLKKYLKLK